MAFISLIVIAIDAPTWAAPQYKSQSDVISFVFTLGLPLPLLFAVLVKLCCVVKLNPVVASFTRTIARRSL